MVFLMTLRLHHSISFCLYDQCYFEIHFHSIPSHPFQSLAAKVQSRSAQLEELKASGEELSETLTEQGSEQLVAKLAHLTSQQQELAQRLKTQEETLRQVAIERRIFEADTNRVEQWCQETDMTCSADLPTDCATEVLEEQVQQYRVSYRGKSN